MKVESSATARLEARLLNNEVLSRLKRAAEIQGRTLTDFVVAAADEAACRAIEQTEIIRLSIEDQWQIVKALSSPPKPTPALKRAFRRRRQLLGEIPRRKRSLFRARFVREQVLPGLIDLSALQL